MFHRIPPAQGNCYQIIVLRFPSQTMQAADAGAQLELTKPLMQGPNQGFAYATSSYDRTPIEPIQKGFWGYVFSVKRRNPHLLQTGHHLLTFVGKS